MTEEGGTDVTEEGGTVTGGAMVSSSHAKESTVEPPRNQDPPDANVWSPKAPEEAMIQDLDTVVLNHSIPAQGLQQGDIGAVVHVYEGGKAFEVEFVTAAGRTVALVTLTPEDFRPMASTEILHVRELKKSA